MTKTVLINPFELPEDQSDEEFLAGWQRAGDYLRSQPGFISARLHGAISPNPRFRFINVAEWESPRAFHAAVTSDGFRQLGNGTPANYPALYEVVTTIQRDDVAASAASERA